MKRGLYTRNLIIAFIFLFVTFCAVVIWIQRTNDRNEKEQRVSRQAEEYADGLARYYAIHGDSIDVIHALFPDYLRISLIEEQGHVLYDSASEGHDLTENHLDRPEVQQAFISGKGDAIRHSTTLGKNMYYLAKSYPEGFFIRVAIPSDVEYSAFTKPSNYFTFIVAGFFLFSLLIVMLFVGYYHRSLKALQRFVTAANNKKGEFADVAFPRGELGDIGREITHTFKILSDSRDRVRLEREKMIEHFAISNEGIVFFSRKREFIYANSNFMQLMNAITDEPTFVIDERILKSKEFQPADNFIKSPPKGQHVFRYPLKRSGGHYEVTVYIFPDNSFEILLSNVSTQTSERHIKHEMTSNIAHELRTPISCIRGYIETLLDSKVELTEEKKTLFLQRAYDQLLRLSDLIVDLSQLTKLQEAPALYQKEDIRFDLIAAEVGADLADKLESSQMAFTNHISEPLVVWGNRSLLYALLRNLLENSIRYAGKGKTIDLYLSSKNSTHYYFSFSDNGPGVPEEALGKLFDRFYRTDEGRARTGGGSGLGLSIVKNAILFHGGSIQAKKRTAGGLEVVFSLGIKMEDEYSIEEHLLRPALRD